MRTVARFFSVALTSALLAAPAAAQSYTFSMTGGFEAFWTLPASPTPNSVLPDKYFFITNVLFTQPNNVQTLGSLTFLNQLNGGAFWLTTFDLSTTLDFFGPQLFSGTLQAPTFIPGTYNLGSTAPSTLTIASTVVPEPSSIALLAAGLAGLASVVRRRRGYVAAGRQ